MGAGRIRGAENFGNRYMMMGRKSPLRAKSARKRRTGETLEVELLSLKMGDFHRDAEGREEYNRVWLRKCGQYFLIPTKERTLYSHVEADESASNTWPAS
jgi:hypothetical protein